MQGKISLRNVDMPSHLTSRYPCYAIESGLAGLHEYPVVQSGASKVAVSVRLKKVLFGRTRICMLTKSSQQSRMLRHRRVTRVSQEVQIDLYS